MRHASPSSFPRGTLLRSNGDALMQHARCATCLYRVSRDIPLLPTVPQIYM